MRILLFWIVVAIILMSIAAHHVGPNDGMAPVGW